MQTPQYDMPLSYPGFPGEDQKNEEEKKQQKPLKELPLYKILRPINGKLEILLCKPCETNLYEDEFKIICEPNQVHPHIRLCEICSRKNIWNNDRLYFTKGAGVHRIREMKEEEELLIKKKGKTEEELQELKSLNSKICWGQSLYDLL
jgi:hypothetical protein